MDYFSYCVSKEQSLNIVKYSDINLVSIDTDKDIIDAEVSTHEGYHEVEYPVRKDFLRNLKEIELKHNLIKKENIYNGFENPRIEFSTFISTPHLISTFLECEIEVESTGEYEFMITTCGRACLWVNDNLVEDYKPYARNKGMSEYIKLSLEEGKNLLNIYIDDLAERDVNFFFDMKLISDTTIKVNIPVNYTPEIIEDAFEFLTGLYLEKDYFSSGNIEVLTDSNKYEEIVISYDNPLLSYNSEGGNITDFDRKNQKIRISEDKFIIGKVNEIKTSGITRIYILIKMPDGNFLSKKLVFSVYDKENMMKYDGNTLKQRKNQALSAFSNLSIPDMNSLLASYIQKEKVDEDTKEYKMKKAYTMIESHGDCADFMFAPLLSFLVSNKELLPTDIRDKIKELALNFRYWIDEPGNDVMWYFSENHALLFHTCQYFAGSLYPDDYFYASNKTGNEHYTLGKKRLAAWFNQFENYGFSEWNSTTYLPIDLIGFFSLYNAAPDEDVKNMAKQALDFTFKVIAINHHGGSLASTYGRIYEHDLKAMRLGDISNILEIAWNKGFANYSIRAAVLFCMSDYNPPIEVEKYLSLKENEALTANYLQGINEVETYLYKTINYSLASAIRYKEFERGHQQHLMNISLGEDATQLWINNPGEFMQSGENRPSYWAGNGICPSISQYKNTCFINYRLKKAALKKIHLYLPYWQIDEINEEDEHWIFIRKGTAYSAVFFSNKYKIEDDGPTRNREVYSLGVDHNVIVKCSSKEEAGTFNNFIELIQMEDIEDGCFDDFQWGEIKNTEDGLLVNGKKVNQTPSYEIKPVMEAIKGLKS